jgi:phage tail sheath gpL-like
MTIQTGVPNNLLRPQTFHTFTVFKAGGGLTNVPLRIVLIGAQRSTATATVNTVTDLSNLTTTQVDALYGQSSEAALMFRQAIACANLFQRGPRVFGVGIAESAGVANVKTATVVGTATADGNLLMRISGRPITVGVATGTTQNTIAAAINSAALAIAATIPVLPTVATNVVTFTHATKGVNGIDVQIVVDQQVPGVVVTVANTVTGTLVTDHQPALDALSPLRYDGIVFANHASADITEILADRNTRWGAQSKNWGFYFVGETGTIGTATSLASAANDQAVVVSSFEGCPNTCAEIATSTAMLVFSRERPNASYDGAKVPLFAPAIGTLYTPGEVETAIAAGLTAFTAVVDSSGAVTQTIAKCERMVTTKTTTSSQPDDRLRDIGVPRTMVSIAIQIDIGAAQRFGADANPDGVFQTDQTDGQIKDMVSSILRQFSDSNVVNPKFVEQDISQIVVEHDAIVLGRSNVALFYHVVGAQHQIAWQHNVTVGG